MPEMTRLWELTGSPLEARPTQGGTDLEEQAPPSRGSIKLSCTWSGVLCVVTGHHWAPRARLAIAPRAFPCGGRRRGSTRGLRPKFLPRSPCGRSAGASPLRITVQGHGPERATFATLFNCICFTHPWVFGNDGPRGTPNPIPGCPQLQGLSPSHPPVLTGHWTLVQQGC